MNYNNEQQTYTCPVCGFDNLSKPPRNEKGGGSFEICPSCGTEFGYHDSTRSDSELRHRWLKAGARWHSKSRQPPQDWDPYKQLRRAGFAGP
jgi:hypothetical protein